MTDQPDRQNTANQDDERMSDTDVRHFWMTACREEDDAKLRLAEAQRRVKAFTIEMRSRGYCK